MKSLTFKILLWVMLAGAALPAFAEHEAPAGRSEAETFQYLNEAFPLTNLKDQFREDIPRQGGTSACGSFASIGILEAACKRAIHKKLDLSEAFLAYRQLRPRIHQHGLDLYHLTRDERLFAAAEAQNPGAILKDVQTNRAICTEAELGFDHDFFPLVQDLKEGLLARFHAQNPAAPPIVATQSLPPGPAAPIGLVPGQAYSPISPVNFEREKIVFQGLKKELCTSLDGSLACRLGSQKSDASGVLPAALSPELKSCLNELAPARVVKDASVKQVITLLAAGQPLACAQSKHAFVIQGARASPTQANRVEFLVRDSASRKDEEMKPQWRTWSNLDHVCYELVVLPTRAEAAAVDAIVEATDKTKQAERAERFRALELRYGTGPWPSDAY